MLVLDGGADGDANDLDGYFEVVVDGQSHGRGRAALVAAAFKDISDDDESLVVGFVVAGCDGELDGFVGFLGEVYIGDSASSNGWGVVGVVSLASARARDGLVKDVCDA